MSQDGRFQGVSRVEGLGGVSGWAILRGRMWPSALGGKGGGRAARWEGKPLVVTERGIFRACSESALESLFR